MRCSSCEHEFAPDNIRWFDEYAYCEDCFHDNYTYCARCDTAIDRDYARYNGDDDPMCEDCFCEDYDHDAPDNPCIDNEQRDEIISLAKDWLNGKKPKRLIKVNPNDLYLKDIQSELGLVDHVLYLYGLQDREEYQIKASPNLYNLISQYTTLNNWNVIISHDIGSNRIGISRSLRENNLPQIINLLKNLSTTPQETAA